MKSFDCNGRRLEVWFAQTKGDDIIAGQVKHFANASWLYSQRSVAEVAHAFPFRCWLLKARVDDLAVSDFFGALIAAVEILQVILDQHSINHGGDICICSEHSVD